uniref:protein transport protein Sec24B isoform X2 n=1 Tax=Myxine glutinosa TaxID=7769 RepID=UPI00358FA343
MDSSRSQQPYRNGPTYNFVQPSPAQPASSAPFDFSQGAISTNGCPSSAPGRVPVLSCSENVHISADYNTCSRTAVRKPLPSPCIHPAFPTAPTLAVQTAVTKHLPPVYASRPHSMNESLRSQAPCTLTSPSYPMFEPSSNWQNTEKLYRHQDDLKAAHYGLRSTPSQTPSAYGQQASCFSTFPNSKYEPIAAQHGGVSGIPNTNAQYQLSEPSTLQQDACLSYNHQTESDGSTTTESPDPATYDTLEGGTEPVSSGIERPMQKASGASHIATSGWQGHSSLPPGYLNTGSSTPCAPPVQVGPPITNLTGSLTTLGLQDRGVSSGTPGRTKFSGPVNLLQEGSVAPQQPVDLPQVALSHHLRKLNCNPEVMRCTLTAVPQSQALLSKAKLPLGLLLHPFKDLSQLPVITSSVIVRCRTCRTYINPFVTFMDQRRWKCNLCSRLNEVPEEFMFNPVTRNYGEPQKRPEVQNATVEFVAPSEYMLRPPQAAVYLFVLDVTYSAIESGYLQQVCAVLLENLDRLPGDSRTRIGFLTFDGSVHFYKLQQGLTQPHMLVVSDVDDMFLPTPDGLLVNLQENKEIVQELLQALPATVTQLCDTRCAFGPALRAAHLLMAAVGGRVTVFLSQLPSLGVGVLHPREDPNRRSDSQNILHLGPATDFYKRLALECSGQQIAVDLFVLGNQYMDIASLSCLSRYSSGAVYYYPGYHHIHCPIQVKRLRADLHRYLTRKIGFEAVMRIRCTTGLSVHTFHGNLFVRSTDLLSLPNVNPDAGFAVQISVEDSLSNCNTASFQAALLYTSSKGDRRIRVHTLCLPVVTSLSDVYDGADVQAVTCLLANMAVDRAVSSNLSDARAALVNAVHDSLSSFRSTTSNLQQAGLTAPSTLRLFPLYILALLKQTAFRVAISTRLDERVFMMLCIKALPLAHLLPALHPDLFRVDKLSEQPSLMINERIVPQPPMLPLSSQHLHLDGVYLLDSGFELYLWVGRNCSSSFLRDVLGMPNYFSLSPNMSQLPELQSTASQQLQTFIAWLREKRPFYVPLHVIKDDSSERKRILQHMVEDRSESAPTYYDFLVQIQTHVCK